MADINALLTSVSSISPVERTVLLAALSTQASVQLNREDIGDTRCEAGGREEESTALIGA